MSSPSVYALHQRHAMSTNTTPIPRLYATQEALQEAIPKESSTTKGDLPNESYTRRRICKICNPSSRKIATSYYTHSEPKRRAAQGKTMMASEKATSGDSKLQPIPQVPTHLYGLLGNLPDMDPAFPARALWRLTDIYGPVFQLQLGTHRSVVLSTYELIKEALDDAKYEKVVSGGVEEVRTMLKDGLFTAYNDEPNWSKAHRILMPVFGPMAVKKMFADQLDIASQMILKWDREGPGKVINTADDFTRLAFDTIGICAFSYRFNQFYSEHVHPFASHMADGLIEAGKRANRTRLETSLRIFSADTYNRDIQAMHKLCDDVIENRRQNPQENNHDLLATMMSAKDPITGEMLDAENIRSQMSTFLVAGHETTSGTLSFLFHNLLTHPDTLHKAQKEVDDILGTDTLTVNHLPQLRYLDACIKETLRYQGPIGFLNRHCKKDELLGGKYSITPKDTLVCNLRGMHHDPAIWGEDADEFKPDRMLDMSSVPRGAFSPFGYGLRGCIGRAFAEQEMLINFALILQRFQVEMADPSYRLELKSTLTVKPKDFAIKVRRRPGRSLMVGIATDSAPKETKSQHQDQRKTSTEAEHGVQNSITILYGSNAGTCKSFAEEVQSDAAEAGIKANIKTLDEATEHAPTNVPLVIITSSYEGLPPDNSKKLVSWLQANSDDTTKFKGLKYALFGVGNSEWASTFHRVPKLIDSLLEKTGAERICATGFCDVKIDPIGPFEDWCEKLFPALAQIQGKAQQETQVEDFHVDVTKSNIATALGSSQMSYGIVRKNFGIASDMVGASKRQTDIELPPGAAYRAGDYLVILAHNHPDVVSRVLRRFNLLADDKLVISGTKKPYLSNVNETAFELFSSRVELSIPATQRQIDNLIKVTLNDKEKQQLESLRSDENFLKQILQKRVSILDLLLDHPSIELPVSTYLSMLKPLAPRQYSISSSPLAPGSQATSEDSGLIVSISYDVQTSEHSWASQDRPFYGVASSYLATRPVGSRIHCNVRPTGTAFQLPSEMETPVIMIAAGTGLAPMRALLQERATIAEGGVRTMGKALLYFGCRAHDGDFIYKDELKQWEKENVVSVRPSFSLRGPQGQQNFRYTYEHNWADREELRELFGKGAKIFVCGSTKLGNSTADTLKKIYREKQPDKSEKDANQWFESVRETRYVSDVFG